MNTTPRRYQRTLSSAAAIGFIAALLAGCGTSSSTPSALPSGTTSIASPATAQPSSEVSTPAATPTPSPTPIPAPTGPVSVTLKTVVAGLSHPIGVEIAPGDPRLFVIGQAGQIFIVSAGKVAGTFLDISGRISCCGERGLLGLAFHPQYATNGRFFVRYTIPGGNVRISEFHVSSDPAKADATSEKVLLTIPHPNFANHNGGRIEFGPDGYLYIGTGDGGSGGDPNNHGQSLATLLGKLLRIDVDQTTDGKPYGIPATNPFVSKAGALPEIFSYGLRNPYTFSFDRSNGDLWIADVGQDLWEEVDRAPASTGGGNGINYGWSTMEGNHCYKPSSGCNMTGLTLPLAEYNHGAGDSNGCAIIGGYVYRGTDHPELTGRYFFGDECSGRIWNVVADGPSPQTPQQSLKSTLTIVGWGQDLVGEIYVVAANGSIYQLV
jgi:glucose/arabinose dehydrogenase